MQPAFKEEPHVFGSKTPGSLPKAAGAASLGDQGSDSGAVGAAGAVGVAASRKKEKRIRHLNREGNIFQSPPSPPLYTFHLIMLLQ